MDKKEIQSQVKQVIAKVLKISEATINDDANLIFDLGADSQQSIELVAAFEEEFNIQMQEDKALSAQTVSQAVEVISSYLK